MERCGALWRRWVVASRRGHLGVMEERAEGSRGEATQRGRGGKEEKSEWPPLQTAGAEGGRRSGRGGRHRGQRRRRRGATRRARAAEARGAQRTRGREQGVAAPGTATQTRDTQRPPQREGRAHTGPFRPPPRGWMPPGLASLLSARDRGRTQGRFNSSQAVLTGHRRPWSGGVVPLVARATDHCCAR